MARTKALLTVEKRDELLIRLDERMQGIKDGDEGDIPEIKKHLVKLNDKVASNCTWIGAYRWAIGGLFLIVLTILGVVLL